MPVLIVESNPHLGGLWKRHLERGGHVVTLVRSQDSAIAVLRAQPVSIIVLNLMLEQGSAFAVADYANFRVPKVKVVFVTSTSFFSDGSIFSHASNACAYVPTSAPVDDLAALVEHYAVND